MGTSALTNEMWGIHSDDMRSCFMAAWCWRRRRRRKKRRFPGMAADNSGVRSAVLESSAILYFLQLMMELDQLV